MNNIRMNTIKWEKIQKPKNWANYGQKERENQEIRKQVKKRTKCNGKIRSKIKENDPNKERNLQKKRWFGGILESSQLAREEFRNSKFVEKWKRRRENGLYP